MWKGRRARPALPLEEAVGRNEAATPPHGLAEGRALEHALDARVDHARTHRDVLRPARHEAPAPQLEHSLARRAHAHDADAVPDLLGRELVPAQLPRDDGDVVLAGEVLAEL